MLRILVNILLLILVARLLRPVVMGARRYFRGLGGSRDSNSATPPVDNLSNYEIEDAEFEEIGKDKR